jgi:hypothetical protein
MSEERRTDISKSLGIEPEKVKSVQFELSTLKKQGILIDLEVNGTGMFSKAANWADIGIQEDDNDPRYTRFTTGQKYLIPEREIKKLRSVETRMRQWLEKLTYRIPGFSPYRWLPYTAYEAWRTKWAELLNDFSAVKAEIIENYDEYKKDLADSFTEVAEASWKSITAQGYDYVIDYGRVYDHDSFISHLVEVALSKVPTVETIESKLKADYITALVYGPSDIAQEEEAAQAASLRMREERVQSQARENEAYLQSEILRDQLNHQQEMNRLEEDEKRIRVDAMYQAEAEHARGQLNDIVSPFQEVFTALRLQFAESAEEMLSSIKKNGFIRGKIAEKGAGLIEVFDLLAVHDDRELRKKLVELKTSIGPIGEKSNERDPEEIKGILEEIKGLATTAADDLAKSPSRFSLIEM